MVAHLSIVEFLKEEVCLLELEPDKPKVSVLACMKTYKSQNFQKQKSTYTIIFVWGIYENLHIYKKLFCSTDEIIMRGNPIHGLGQNLISCDWS